MEKEQKKRYAKIIINGILIMLFSLSLIFNSHISNFIHNVLYDIGISSNKDDLTVHFIKVGQGDAIAIHFANGKTMLIDAGPKDSQNILIEYLKNNIFQSSKDYNIDYLVLTHSDLDHAGGMNAVLSEFNVKNFYRPNIASLSERVQDFATKSETKEYDEIIKSAKDKSHINIKILNQYYEFDIGEAKIKIFSPTKAYSTTNAMSCVVKVSYCEKSFLFAGDIYGESEEDIISKHKNELDCDVLKVAHHGSEKSTSDEFIKEVSPQYAVICVGNNTYGHPDLNTIERLRGANITILTTLQQNIVLRCGDDGIHITPKDKTITYEFWQWYNIVIVVNIILLAVIIKHFVQCIKIQKQIDMSKNV